MEGLGRLGCAHPKQTILKNYTVWRIIQSSLNISKKMMLAQHQDLTEDDGKSYVTVWHRNQLSLVIDVHCP